jgi:hypothetical protein
MTFKSFGYRHALIFQAAVGGTFITALNQQTRLPFTPGNFAFHLNLRQRFLQLVQNLQRGMAIMAEQAEYH